MYNKYLEYDIGLSEEISENKWCLVNIPLPHLIPFRRLLIITFMRQGFEETLTGGTKHTMTSSGGSAESLYPFSLFPFFFK